MSDQGNKEKAKEVFNGWPKWKRNFSVTKHAAQKREGLDSVQEKKRLSGKQRVRGGSPK